VSHYEYADTIRFDAAGLRQDLLERLDHHIGVDPCCNVRVCLGPGLGVGQGSELGHDQAAGEPGVARVIAVDGRVRAGQYDAAFSLQLFEALDMGRAYAQAFSRELATSVAMMA